ncbi:MAG: hypothetical protein EOP50_03375 [Sphingobacteriales bacterium]|nr:MAG: hypothetical protein EOP50_03375 [Sphingobacteriales bacterium]
MNRRKFLKQGCTACLSLTAASVFLSACTNTRYLSGELVRDGITVHKTDFLNGKTNGAYTSFIIIRNNALQFPICLFRVSDTEYNALWMKCSHQGAELQASGDVLQCPAHGSEFSNKGIAISGPANGNLRSFPVRVIGDEIFIDLRKQA